MRGHIPNRTCVGCRRVCLAAELVRLRAPDGLLQVSGASASAGRGVWVHPQAACVAAAVKARAFARTLRRALVVPESGELTVAVMQTFAQGTK